MNKHLLVAFLTFLAFAFVYYVDNADALHNDALDQFPMKIHQWVGQKSPLEEWVFQSLETPYAIMRNYVSTGKNKINLAIVWYDDREIAFHAPEACLGGVGNTVARKRGYKLNLNGQEESDIGELIVNRYGQSQLVLYYFICDGFVTQNQTRLRFEILKNRLKFKRTSAAFIRVMADINKDTKITRQLLENFLRISYPAIDNATQTLKAVTS